MPDSRQTAPFTPLDWVLLLFAGAMWGSSFFFIKVAVADLPPVTIGWLRLLLGAATLALFPGARVALRRREDWWPIGLLGLTWMGAPFVLLPIAEQTIPSALAGMLNGATPVFAAAIAALGYRQRLSPQVLLGLAIGFGGVVGISLPSIGGSADLAGVGLMLFATLLFGLAFNMTEPLERRNGPLAVIFRAELVAAAALTPFGIVGLFGASPTPTALGATAALGVLSTGVAFAAFTVLIGRVGAARASVTIYLVPAVSIALGAGIAGERVSPWSLGAIALVLLGAFLTSRGRARSKDLPTSTDAESPGAASA